MQIIQSLSKEERVLLDEKLKKPDWQTVRQQIIYHAAAIDARRGGKPLNPPLEDYIQQTREERNQQHDELMESCFPQSEVT